MKFIETVQKNAARLRHRARHCRGSQVFRASGRVRGAAPDRRVGHRNVHRHDREPLLRAE